MEQGQRIAVYTAGMALQSAQLKSNPKLLAGTDLFVAAAGGERDLAVDSAILTGLADAENPGAFLNRKLMSDLRPTLFLGQLPNLFAGNISILHDVTGASRTFLGEEAAGIDAVRLAAARIAAGQSNITLVGGACHGARKDWLVYVSAAGQALRGKTFTPVFERESGAPGFALGSLGAFLVLESACHAQARGVCAIAKLLLVLSECAGRHPGARTAALERMWATLEPRLIPGHFVVISGATGVEPATSEERAFLMARPNIPVRATGTHMGHGVEAQFSMNVALATVILTHGRFFPASGSFELARALNSQVMQVVITCLGRAYGEGMALLEAATYAT
jgi:3-oxoacyl-[acyl-carrier-protein] synthase II